MDTASIRHRGVCGGDRNELKCQKENNKKSQRHKSKKFHWEKFCQNRKKRQKKRKKKTNDEKNQVEVEKTVSLTESPKRSLKNASKIWILKCKKHSRERDICIVFSIRRKGNRNRNEETKGKREQKGATKNFEICFYFITLHAVHGASGAPETMQNIVKWERTSSSIPIPDSPIHDPKPDRAEANFATRPPGVAAVASKCTSHKAQQQQQLDMYPPLAPALSLSHTHTQCLSLSFSVFVYRFGSRTSDPRSVAWSKSPAWVVRLSLAARAKCAASPWISRRAG